MTPSPVGTGEGEAGGEGFFCGANDCGGRRLPFRYSLRSLGLRMPCLPYAEKLELGSQIPNLKPSRIVGAARDTPEESDMETVARSVSIFGLGYVGSVMAACLAHKGNRVVGVDVKPAKVAVLNSGRSPILERRMDELV